METKAKKTEEIKEGSKEKEYFESLQRLQAEFDNFRKRTEKEKFEIVKYAEESLIVDLLDVLDNFELSLKYSEDDGVKMIYSELYSLLEKKGLETIETKGDFNPLFHEALMKEDRKEDNKILEELQKGYLLNHKVIRTSKVKISKAMEIKNE